MGRRSRPVMMRPIIGLHGRFLEVASARCRTKEALLCQDGAAYIDLRRRNAFEAMPNVQGRESWSKTLIRLISAGARHGQGPDTKLSRFRVGAQSSWVGSCCARTGQHAIIYTKM